AARTLVAGSLVAGIPVARILVVQSLAAVPAQPAHLASRFGTVTLRRDRPVQRRAAADKAAGRPAAQHRAVRARGKLLPLADRQAFGPGPFLAPPAPGASHSACAARLPRALAAAAAPSRFRAKVPQRSVSSGSAYSCLCPCPPPIPVSAVCTIASP